jgi:hypothetical protein
MRGVEPVTLAARIFVTAFVIALVPLATGTAGAATLSDPPSAVSQYIEYPPTGDGNTTLGNKKTSLSQSSARALETANRSAAAALRDAATSMALGAPKTDLVLSSSARTGLKPTDTSFAGSLKEMGASLFGDGGRVLGLLAGLAVISAAATLSAGRKRRSTS